MGFGSFLKKYVLPAAGIGAMFIPGVGPAVGGALGALGKGISSPLGQQVVKGGLGLLGGVLNANAANQPEKWRQNIVEEELKRRNLLQGYAAPTLSGMLGYRSPQMGQQMKAQLGAAPRKL